MNLKISFKREGWHLISDVLVVCLVPSMKSEVFAE